MLSFVLALVLAALALALAAGSRSLALAAFGLESAIDGCASAVLVWRFRTERRHPHRAEEMERSARRLIAVALFAVVGYLVVASVHALAAGTSPKGSTASVILAAGSVVILPGIAYRKRQLAGRLPSRALRADALLTMVASLLAAVTLAAVALNRYVRFEATDPIAALLMSAILLREAVGALRD